MTRSGGLSAIGVRRLGLYGVLLVCVLTVLAGPDRVSASFLALFVFALYLFCCAEPLRRVLRTVPVGMPLAVTYVVTAVACVGALLALPMDDDATATRTTTSALSRLVGVSRLSPSATDTLSDVSWALFGVAVVGAVTLWGQVARLARRTEWAAIDHTITDGSLATGATLAAPLGSAATRAVDARAVRRPDVGSRGSRRRGG